MISASLGQSLACQAPGSCLASLEEPGKEGYTLGQWAACRREWIACPGQPGQEVWGGRAVIQRPRLEVLLVELRSKGPREGFPGGAVVKNPPANAGDTGLSPALGRSPMPQSNQARAPQLLSLRSRAHVPQLLKPPRLDPVLRNEKPQQ